MVPTLVSLSIPTTGLDIDQGRETFQPMFLVFAHQKCSFVYILFGWEGSTVDGRVLRNAIGRANGLKVSQGCYYLVDAGYTNGSGFLAPYRGQRYHLSDIRESAQPSNPREYFNIKHSQVRNCIERCLEY